MASPAHHRWWVHSTVVHSISQPARTASAALQETSVAPQSLRVLGRHPTRENVDICGEYSCVGDCGGHPAYQNTTTGVAVRFFGGRWLIDRGGLRDSPVCVAFAEQVGNCSHPANPELVWHVWESQAQTHVEDSTLVAIDAPKELMLLGRAYDRHNSPVNGKYVLVGSVHGRAAYRHEMQDLLLHFHAPEGRWLISASGDAGTNACNVCADAGTALHPGDATLQWQFWEPDRNMFITDPSVVLVDAPEVINVVGRHPLAANFRINGTYHLAGVHALRPLYVQPGTSTVIRYSAKNDCWLIKLDGLSKPSLLSRLYQYVLTGDSETAYDQCSAWAKACHSLHPAQVDLEWHVWETVDHVLDRSVAVTAAPLSVQVTGRDFNRGNADVNGEYQLAGTIQGRAVYSKLGTEMCIYFSKSGAKWVIDRHGMAGNDTGVCVAFIEGLSSGEHPASTPHTWSFYEPSQACFVPDSAVSLAVPSDISADSAMCDQLDVVHGQELKRNYGMDPDCMHMAYPPQFGMFGGA